MNNVEILSEEMALRNIKEECHTYQDWKRYGYQVKKGEKALFQTEIWNFTHYKDPDKEDHYYKKKASFFGLSQTEKVDEVKKEEVKTLLELLAEGLSIKECNEYFKIREEQEGGV